MSDASPKPTNQTQIIFSILRQTPPCHASPDVATPHQTSTNQRLTIVSMPRQKLVHLAKPTKIIVSMSRQTPPRHASPHQMPTKYKQNPCRFHASPEAAMHCQLRIEGIGFQKLPISRPLALPLWKHLRIWYCWLNTCGWCCM